MDAAELLSRAKGFLGDKAWCAETVLRIGSNLAQVVNSLKNLSGNDKAELVCQTILKLIDDEEMAEKERCAVSTETKKTSVPWNDCRKVVKNILPVTLELLVKASRGEIRLPSVESNLQQICLPYLNKVPGLSFLSALPALPVLPALRRLIFCKQKNVSENAEPSSSPASEGIANLVKDPLSEVRELVLRVEKMLKEAQNLPEVKAANLQQNLLLPSPESNAVLLPGELQNPVGVPASQ